MWIQLDRDGTLTVLSPHTEMGQGSQTGLLQIVADELDASWERCRVRSAPATTAFGNGTPIEGFLLGETELSGFVERLVQNGFHQIGGLGNLQMTGGSTAVRFTGWRSMRVAAAAARTLLAQAAADRWGVDPASVRTADHAVHHDPSGRRLDYGALAHDAAARPVPAAPRLKTAAERTYVGRPMPRPDLPPKVFGAPVYGIDEDVPGMRFAAVRFTDVLGAPVARVPDRDAVLGRRGVEAVVILDEAIAVVADNPWRAEQAVRAATLEAAPHPNASLTTASLEQALWDELDGGLSTLHTAGRGAAPLDDGGPVLEAAYAVPYLAHTPLEPMNATVWRDGDVVHFAGGMQNPLMVRAHVADTLGIAHDRVVVQPRWMGGGFGRRGGLGHDILNWVTQAVRIQEQVGGAVKMIWSREADIRGSRFRPMQVARLRGRVGDDGLPQVMDIRFAGTVTDAETAVPPYPLPHVSVRHTDRNPPLPFAFWRSVDGSTHPFWLETFFDRLVREAGGDPLEARLRLLVDDPRARRVLETVAEQAGWRHGVDAQGRAMGVAFTPSFGSVVAQIAQVSLQRGSPRVHRVWAAVDCGVAINPDSIEAQIQGGVHYGLSAALYGRIDLENGRIVQSNFHDYRAVSMADAPRVDVRILETDGAPVGGIGEVGVPAIAPAVANALARLEDAPRDRLPLVV